MLTKTFCFTCVFAASMACMGAATQAGVILFDVNFEANPPGSVEIQAPNSGETASKPTVANNATVVAGGFNSTRVAKLTDSSTSSGSALQFNANDADSVSTGLVRVSFDLVIETVAGATGRVSFSARSNPVVVFSTVNIDLDDGDVNFTNSSVSEKLGTLVRGQAYAVVMEFDFAAGTQTLSIAGVGSQSGTLTATNFDNFAFGTNNAAIGRVALDNVMIGEVIPEPGAISLALLPVLLTACRRRR